jgi:hypothetical protein
LHGRQQPQKSARDTDGTQDGGALDDGALDKEGVTVTVIQLSLASGRLLQLMYNSIFDFDKKILNPSQNGRTFQKIYLYAAK